MSDVSEHQENVEKSKKKYEHVLISVANPRSADQLVRLGRAITGPSSILHISNVTTETPFPRRMSSWRKSSQLVIQMTHLAMRLGRVARPMAVTARSIPKALISAAKETEADLIIMGWFGRVTPIAVKKSKVVNRILHRAPCDTAVLKLRNPLQEVQRLVLPVGLKFNADQLAVVRALRQTGTGKVVLMQVLTPRMTREEEKAREVLSEHAQALGEPVETLVVRARNVVEGILRVTEEDDLIVIGPGREWVFNKFLFGLRADQITNRAPCSVLLYKSQEMKARSWFRALIKTVWSRVTGAEEI